MKKDLNKLGRLRRGKKKRMNSVIRYFTKQAWDGLYDLHKETVKAIPEYQDFLYRPFQYKWAAIVQAVSWAILYGEAFLKTTTTQWIVIRSV